MMSIESRSMYGLVGLGVKFELCLHIDFACFEVFHCTYIYIACVFWYVW